MKYSTVVKTLSIVNKKLTQTKRAKRLFSFCEIFQQLKTQSKVPHFLSCLTLQNRSNKYTVQKVTNLFKCSKIKEFPRSLVWLNWRVIKMKIQKLKAPRNSPDRWNSEIRWQWFSGKKAPLTLFYRAMPQKQWFSMIERQVRLWPNSLGLKNHLLGEQRCSWQWQLPCLCRSTWSISTMLNTLEAKLASRSVKELRTIADSFMTSGCSELD